MRPATEPTKPFEILADHIALDFVNTLDDRYSPNGPAERLTSFACLLGFCEQAGILTKGEAALLRDTVHGARARSVLASAIELRDALFALFTASVHGSPPTPDALAVLNRFLRGPNGPQQVVAWDVSRFVRRPVAAGIDAEGLLHRIAEGAAELLTSPDLAHVRECGADTCRWLFLDTSRNHSRRWCDMKTCGNRSKARRFHARRLEAPTRPPE